MTRNTTWYSRRSRTKTAIKRRSLRLEWLEPRIALSGSEATVPDWIVAPYALSDTSTCMTVKQEEGMEYFFHNITIEEHDSGWITQADTPTYYKYQYTGNTSYVTYVDQTLSENTPYEYEVKSRVKTTDDTGDTSAYSVKKEVTTMTDMEAAVEHLVNQIRAVETFSNPDNPGQIYQQLVANQYPKPTEPNNYADCEKSGTNGLSAYPRDLRNTPGAFQVDLINIGHEDLNNPALEVFGQWDGKTGSYKKNDSVDTQIAFSSKTLHDFFNIDVDPATGYITHIEAASASVFLHDDAIADDVANWDPDNNPLIGLHIDNFQSEQLSLYLADRSPSDASVGVQDARTSSAGVMYQSQKLQQQTSKSFIYAVYQKYLTHPSYKTVFENVVNMYGVTLEITSSQKTNIFGINQGEKFKCRLTPGFVVGGAYVSGEGSMFNLLTAMVNAYTTGTGTWTIPNEDPAKVETITFTCATPGGDPANTVITVDKTPINVSDSFPSIFHYGAVVSPFGMADYTVSPEQFDPNKLIVMSGEEGKQAWGIEDRNTKDGLGYPRMAAEDIHTVSGTQIISTGGRYNYTDLQDGKTLTVVGDGTFVIVGPSSSASGITVTSAGYNITANNNQSISNGQVIDVSDFFDQSYMSNNTDLMNSCFYGWVQGGVQQMARVNDASVPTGTALQLYIVPAAKDLGAAGPQAVIDNMNTSFWQDTSPYFHSVRVLMPDGLSVFGTATSADQWATHFTTSAVSGGTGVIDASQATGKVLIVLNDTIKTVKLGSGSNAVTGLVGNSSQKTYVLNPNSTVTPTIDIRSGDVVDWSQLPQGITWQEGSALTFDNKAASDATAYLRYSYYAGWTGSEGATTEGAFEAIVRAGGNTGTNDPTKIVENALAPLTVTINRTATQADQTSASLMNFAVVFSEAATDFDETDVTLSGPTATTSGASIVVTDSGDHLTYNVAVTLEYTAGLGNVTATIGAGAAHDTDGFSNLASTSTSNVITYKPNTITGQGNSNVAGALGGGEPLPGMAVALTRTGFTTRTTTTDSNGDYQFANVPDGTYEVTITPPSACLDTGSDSTTINASNSQTYDADFSVGALKAAYIPNRMMITSSLPVGSVQWREVVQEALNLGDSSSAQYLTLAVETESLAAPEVAAVQEDNVEVVAMVNTPTEVEPEETVPEVVTVIEVAPEPVVTSEGETELVDVVQAPIDTEPEEIVTEVAASIEVAPEPAVTEQNTVEVVDPTPTPVDSEPELLTQEMVAPIVQEAIDRWASVGLDQDALDLMENVTFLVSDLDGLHLGMTQGNTVWLDKNAAGSGWFVDTTPDADQEFRSVSVGGPLVAMAPEISNRVDLLTAIAHELGHIAGLEDSDDGNLMAPNLKKGLRLIPSAHDAVLADYY